MSTRNPPVVLPHDSKWIASFPGANWVLQNLDTQLWSNCPALIWKFEGAGWFNPIDVGNSSKEGRDYTKTCLNSSTCLEIAKPRKSIPTLFPRKGRNNLGNVNSKVGTLALACSLLIQEAWPSFPRLAPCLWNIAVLIEDYLKLSLGGYFYQAPSKKSNDFPISSSAGGNPGLTISPCEVLNPATLLPTPEGSLPFHSCLDTLDHWTKPQAGLSKDPLTNPEEIWYTDGNSFVLDLKRRHSHAVV